jgi:hypothetical protein
MRTNKLTTALVAAAASLTLSFAAAPTAGARVPHPHGGGRPGHGCRVTLDFAYRVIEANQPATAVGTLTCANPSEEVGQTVTLYQRAANTPKKSTYTVAGTGTTEAGGAYSIEVKGITTDSIFYALAGGLPSLHRALGVTAEVKVEGPTEGVIFTGPLARHHRKVAATFNGTVSPLDEGARVVLQRQNALNGNGWFSISKPAIVNAKGEYTIEHQFVIPGPANIRVLVRDPKVNLPSASNVLSYEISQRENPQFTIESKADPISYGQSVTIGGAVAGVPVGTAVKLLARAANQNHFAVVGEAKTEDSTGKYTFASQTPLVNTYYKAEAGASHSTITFEGVKYVLTAALLPGTTVSKGTELTFSGTVKPGVVKHIVYLERENASHTAFNVVETTEVQAPNAEHPEYWYSLKFAPEFLGTNKYRVKIPGDPQNGSTESETFTITVTPGLASAIKPGATPTLPSEGQV